MSRKMKIARDAFFVLGVMALGIMIYKIGVHTIFDNLCKTGWWFFAIIGVWALVYIINALSFHTIIRDGSTESKTVRYLRTLKLTISGYAINYITPLGLLGGEPYRIMVLQRQLGAQKATSSVVLYAMMHFASHFIFWMLSVPMFLLIVPVISLSIKIILWAMIFGSVLLLCWAFYVFNHGVIHRAFRLGARLPFIGRKIEKYRSDHEEKLQEMDFLIMNLYKNRKKDFFTALGLELLSRYTLCLEVVIMMHSVHLPITFIQSVLTESFSSLFANMLFFAPLQLGTREGGFALAFGFLSIPTAYGIYVSLCTRIRELFWILVGITLVRIKSDE